MFLLWIVVRKRQISPHHQPVWKVQSAGAVVVLFFFKAVRNFALFEFTAVASLENPSILAGVVGNNFTYGALGCCVFWF